MQRILLFTLGCLLLPLSASAQRTAVWDGGPDGTGTDWGTAANWDTDVAPVTGDTVVFNTTTTVSGTSTAEPVQLRISGDGTMVTLNLDLTIGGSTTPLNAVIINANSRLVLGTGTFNINPEVESNGIHISSIADGASVNIQADATVNITGGKHGINHANATANLVARGTLTISGSSGNGIRHTAGLIENRGLLTISNTAANGIDNDASFTNFRSSTTVLNITNAGNRGINNKAGGTFINDKDIFITGGGTTTDGIYSEGAFTNMANANITTSGMDDDGIEMVSGTFDNDGTITTTAKNGAGTANNALAINGGTFSNTSYNSLNADGGDVGRAIGISAGGSLINTGIITITGGDDGNRINSGGEVTNDIGGTIDLTDGRINNSGTLTNNGLLISTRGSAGIFNTGTATNNAFFTYGGGNFASGTGTAIDEGIDLDRSASWRIDVENGCSVKIANVSYEYQESGLSVGTSAADGTLTFDDMTFSAADINIKPIGLSFPTGLKVRLQNATCNLALPIELTTLEAIAMPKFIMLKWTVATEIDNDYIAVERSTDGIAFSEMGRIAGNGTRDFAADYEWEDRNPVAGTNFYRLRQVDLDGTINYSYVVSAEFAGEDARTLRIFPTVVSAGGELNVDLRERPTALFSLTDAHGRQVSVFELAGGDIATLPIGKLKSGMYYLRTEGNPAATRFIIK